MYVGWVYCNCFKNGFPEPPPEEIRDFVRLKKRDHFPKLNYPGENSNHSRDRKVQLFENWTKKICPHREGSFALLSFDDIESDRLLEFLSSRTHFDGTLFPCIPALERHNPLYHSEFPANDAPELLQDLQKLKIPDHSNLIIGLKKAGEDKFLEYTQKSFPILIGSLDRHLIRIGPDGLFISEYNDSYYWEYCDLKILFTSLDFSCDEVLPGSFQFTDMQTANAITIPVTDFFLQEDIRAAMAGHYVVFNENMTLYNIFPKTIDQLIVLAQASVETSNPIGWS